MKTIELLAGTHIERAAKQLVQNAPARAVFNGVPIFARYATTVPSDIVAHYLRVSELRGITYAHSAAGKRVAEEQELRRRSLQATVDAHKRTIVDLDFASCDAVLAWVEDMAPAVDHVDIILNRAALREIFEAGGWEIGVNCGTDFNGEDERNFAGWIVGQWLDCWHPMVTGFIEQWRAKFRPAGFRTVAQGARQ